jgi:hypothetical protein
MRQHKVTFLVPSEKRHDLEKMVEELMEGVEGFQHLGSWFHDPNKPVFRTVPRKDSNGATEPMKHRVDINALITELMARERRPFTRFELCQRLALSIASVNSAIHRLEKEGRVKIPVRGVYELA